MVYKKGQKDAIPEERPLQRSIDAIEATLKVRNRLWEKLFFWCVLIHTIVLFHCVTFQCLCVISQENEVKELLAVFITRIVVRALEVSVCT